MQHFVLALLLTVGLISHARAASLNDVSILLPLPTEADFQQLLSPGDTAVGLYIYGKAKKRFS